MFVMISMICVSCSIFILDMLVPFTCWCPAGALSGHPWENRLMYDGLYQHTRVVLYLLYTQPEISLNY